MTTHTTPPTDPGSPAALPVPTAAPCLSCGAQDGWIRAGRRTPWRARGLCSTCYNRATDRGVLAQYPACGAVPVPHLTPEERSAIWARMSVPLPTFAGFPEGYTPTLRAYPGQPALSVPLHPFPMPVNRWAAATWAWSPDDPRLIGNLSEMLLDRDAQQEAA